MGQAWDDCRVEVAPGTHAIGVDIPLVRSPTYRVTVQTGGASVNDMNVSSNPDIKVLGSNFRAAKKKDGDFELPAMPADYRQRRI